MQDAFQYIKSELKDLYTESEIRCFYFLMAEKLTGCSRTRLVADKNTIFSREHLKIFSKYVKKLREGSPIQYVLGEASFFGMTLSVTPATLIPRPETEELVEWVLSEQKPAAGKALLDIATGSACIALALKRHCPTAFVSAFDISEEALSVAAQNARNLGLDVRFFRADLREEKNYACQWDVIVSNPPYIPLSEKTDMDQNVVGYEPHTALFVPDEDPLLFYRHIARFATIHLKPGGSLYLELHYRYADDCRALFEEAGFRQILLKNDISGKQRMLRVSG